MLKEYAQALKQDDNVKNREVFHRALMALAQAVSQLHMTKSRSDNTWYSVKNFWLDHQNFNIEQQLLYQLGQDTTWEKILIFIDQLNEKIDLEIKSPDYIHEDLHWTNIFYDDNTHEITFIDVATLSKYMQDNKFLSIN